jgi:hypothetical protein
MSSARRQRDFVRYLLPFVTFVVLGSVGLSAMLQTRIDRDDRGASVKPTTRKYEQNKEKKEFDMEAELRKINEKLDIENWKPVPVPPPRKPS